MSGRDLLVAIPHLRPGDDSRAAFPRFSVEDSLARSIQVSGCGRSIRVLVVENGPWFKVGNGAPLSLAERLRSLLRGTAMAAPVAAVASETGKINAVHLAQELARSRDCDLLVVDDDIEVPPEALSWTMRRRYETNEILSARKAAGRWSLAANSTPTAGMRDMALALSPTSIRQLERTAVLPARPSGSFYFLPRSATVVFPNPCNEADVLFELPHDIAPFFVRSRIPHSESLEVERRRRQVNNSSKPSKFAKNGDLLRLGDLGASSGFSHRVRSGLWTAASTMAAASS